MGKGLNNCMSPTRGTRAHFQLDILKSNNNGKNINAANSLQKSRKQFLDDEKGPKQVDPGSCYTYT